MEPLGHFISAPALFSRIGETFSLYPAVTGTLDCLKRFLLYIIPCVIVLLAVRFGTKVPKFVFRKLLHLVAFTCVIIMLLGAETWLPVSAASLVITAVIYPILALLEKKRWFSGLFIEKRPGEIKRSLVFLFGMFALLTAVGWGVFGEPMITAASILMWGVGDASAALIGIPFGKHKVRLPLTDGKKSWEGTLAMTAASFVCGTAFLLLCARMPLGKTLLLCVPGAVTGAAAELFSPSEWDTVSVPAVILFVLLLF